MTVYYRGLRGSDSLSFVGRPSSVVGGQLSVVGFEQKQAKGAKKYGWLPNDPWRTSRPSVFSSFEGFP